jgi:hypothetical protein
LKRQAHRPIVMHLKALTRPASVVFTDLPFIWSLLVSTDPVPNHLGEKNEDSQRLYDRRKRCC